VKDFIRAVNADTSTILDVRQADDKKKRSKVGVLSRMSWNFNIAIYHACARTDMQRMLRFITKKNAKYIAELLRTT
jgi:hypothetical protein